MKGILNLDSNILIARGTFANMDPNGNIVLDDVIYGPWLGRLEIVDVPKNVYPNVYQQLNNKWVFYQEGADGLSHMAAEGLLERDDNIPGVVWPEPGGEDRGNVTI